jgi:class 3 adenylate cyclase/YHS domain-containing protein
VVTDPTAITGRERSTIHRTVAFVDLAGFTALTDVHGDEAAVDLVDAFEDTARTAIDGTGAELVKTIGDAVMLVAPTPDQALSAVRSLFHAVYERESFPEPRAGLHHGPVIERGSDYFGATVNLAARVASRAGSGQVLSTSTLLDASKRAGVDTVALGGHQLRNVLEPVDLWALKVCPTHVDVSVDPVCRMRIACQSAVGTVRHAGAEHRFCSLACVAAFAQDPGRYVEAETAEPL